MIVENIAQRRKRPSARAVVFFQLQDLLEECLQTLRVDLHRATEYLEKTGGKFFYFVARETVDPEARVHARMIFYNGEDGCLIRMAPDILIPAVGASKPPPRRLSQDLRELLRHASGRSVTIAEIEQILRGRGVAMLILLLASPFVIPTPGLSVPFGIAICLLGLRIAVGGRSALPPFILRKEVAFSTLEKVVTRIAGVGSPYRFRLRRVAPPVNPSALKLLAAIVRPVRIASTKRFKDDLHPERMLGCA